MLSLDEKEELLNNVEKLLDAPACVEVYVAFIFEKGASNLPSSNGFVLAGQSSKTTEHKEMVLNWIKRL